MSEVIASGIVSKGALKTYFNTLDPLVSEAKLHFNDDGLRVAVVDPANVAMYRPLTLSRKAFESYDSPGAATVGINISRVLDRIEAADSSELIELELDMEARKLVIHYGPFNHRVALIDPDSVRQEPDIPDIEDDMANVVTLRAKLLKRIVSNVDMVSDHIEFAGDVDAGCVRVLADGDTDDLDIVLDHDHTEGETEVTADCFTLISMDYMEEFVKPIPKDASVTIRFGDQFPLIMEWEATDGHQQATAMCAPRIDNGRQ